MNKVEDYQENYQTGWISLYRSLQNKAWYKKSDYIHLWVHLLLKANHKNRQFWFNGKSIKIKKGQLITGRKILSSETGINQSKIERILKTFESEQQIEQQKTNKNRLITILSYSTYQNSEQQSEQQVNNNRTTSEQQVNTNNNDNNYNNENNIIYRKILHLKLSVEEFNKLNKNNTKNSIDDILDRIENYKNNTKYKSLFLTAKNWLKKENYKKESETQNFTLNR